MEAATRRALADGADDIDVVLPYDAFLAGDEERAGAMVSAVAALVDAPRIVKVILESGALGSSETVGAAARFAIGRGADFVKTSTGKIPAGASLDAARAMLEAIAAADRPIGLKPSGGIRTFDEAMAYVDLADSVMGDGLGDPGHVPLRRQRSARLLARRRRRQSRVHGFVDLLIRWPPGCGVRSNRPAGCPIPGRTGNLRGPCPRSSGDRASASGAVCAGSNPAEGATVNFPDLDARNLEGLDVRLPEGFDGERNVVIIAFRREHQSLVDSWVPWLEEQASADADLRFYEVPTIGRIWAPVRPFIDGGMAASIREPVVLRRTLTVYGDVDRLAGPLDIHDRSTITVVLVDGAGVVQWRGSGGFDTATAAELVGALELMRGGSSSGSA